MICSLKNHCDNEEGESEEKEAGGRGGGGAGGCHLKRTQTVNGKEVGAINIFRSVL